MDESEKLLVSKGQVAWLYGRMDEIRDEINKAQGDKDQFSKGKATGIEIALTILGLEREEAKS